jgi:hypothetical protein
MSQKDDSKQWLQTGDIPTEEQLAQIIDWIRFIEEKIGYNDLTPELKALINSVRGVEKKIFTDDTTIVMAAETWLMHISVYNPGPDPLEFNVNRIGGMPGVPFLVINVPAAGKVDTIVNTTFWVDETMTLVEVTGDVDEDCNKQL